MQNYATKLAEGFSQRVVKIFFERSIADKVTNQDYEGEIKGKLSKLNILTFGAIGLKNYTGSNMSPDDVEESIGELVTDQQKAHYFKILSLSRFKSWIKNPEGTLLEQVASTLTEEVDRHVLSKWSDVAAGHWIGADYTTGTVEIDANGKVTGSGTTFTTAMVGLPFRAAGHEDINGKPIWYRVAARNSNTEIKIVDDLDDTGAGEYTGGAISAGAAYTIQDNAKVQVAKNTIFGFVAKLKQKLDEAKVPMTDRYLVVPSQIGTLLLQSDELLLPVDKAYDEVVQRGLLGNILGFQVYQNEQVAGNNTDGYRVLAMHKSWQTMAMGFTETGIEDLHGNFGKAYKGLTVYGSKVVDERRKAAAMLHCYV